MGDPRLNGSDDARRRSRRRRELAVAVCGDPRMDENAGVAGSDRPTRRSFLSEAAQPVSEAATSRVQTRPGRYREPRPNRTPPGPAPKPFPSRRHAPNGHDQGSDPGPRPKPTRGPRTDTSRG